MAHTATQLRDLDGRLEGYEYRGVEIRLDRSVSTTYWGRYKIGGYRNGDGFTTLKEAKSHIDAKEKND